MILWLFFGFRTVATLITAEAFSAPHPMAKAVTGGRNKLASAALSVMRSKESGSNILPMALSASMSDCSDSKKSDKCIARDTTYIAQQNDDDDRLQISEASMNTVSKEADRVKYFIYVDPLDDFGAATVAKAGLGAGSILRGFGHTIPQPYVNSPRNLITAELSAARERAAV